MAGDRSYTSSTILHHQICSFTDGTGCIDDIIYKDDILTFDISDDGHLCDFVSFGTALMADDHRDS